MLAYTVLFIKKCRTIIKISAAVISMFFELHCVVTKILEVLSFECDFGSKIELNLSLCIIHYPKKKAIEFEVFNSYKSYKIWSLKFKVTVKKN